MRKVGMRVVIKQGLLCLAFLLTLTACGQEPTYQDLQGHEITFSDYHGQWVFINYWASWCDACYREVPVLNAYYQTHKGRKVVILGVNYDLDSQVPLAQLKQKMRIQFPVLTSDPAKQFGLDDIPGLPLTLVIAPNGRLHTILKGEQTEHSLDQAMTIGG